MSLMRHSTQPEQLARHFTHELLTDRTEFLPLLDQNIYIC